MIMQLPRQIIQNGNSIMTFGKYKGSRVYQLPSSYLWALYQYGWIKISKRYYKEFMLKVNFPKRRKRYYVISEDMDHPAEIIFRSAYLY